MVQKHDNIFVVIDGNAIIHRAYHALPPLTVKDGTIVNAVYGFTSMLLKILHDVHPEYIAVSFDVAGRTFRDDIYKEYKATRVKADQELYDQIPLVHQVVQAFNIPIFLKEGFEADDIIGTIAAKILVYNKKAKEKVKLYIVTGDMDILQLVVDNEIEVYMLRKGMSDFVLFNEAEVQKKYGFGPEYIVDYKSLKGDASDNIPGVKGVGDKTAVQLIQEIGGIVEIYKAIKKNNTKKLDTIKPSMLKKLKAGEDDARMSTKLATIRKDVHGINLKLKDCVAREFNRDTVVALLRKFEFYSLASRLPLKDGEIADTKTAQQKNKKKLSELCITVTAKNIRELIDILNKTTVFACRAIIASGNVLDNGAWSLIFVVDKKSFVVSIDTLSKKEQTKLLNIFSQKEKTIVGHNLKELVKALVYHGTIIYVTLFDLMIASYLLNSSTRAHDIHSIVMRELGEDLDEDSSQESLFGTSAEHDAVELRATLRIHPHFVKQLKELNNFDLFNNIEMVLIPVLATMELNGVAVDKKVLARLSIDVAKTIEQVQKKIWKEAKQEFNVSSSTQLRSILFDTLDLPTKNIKKGKTGYSTAASELEKLRDYHSIISMIEEYREVEKLRNTYIDVLPTLIHPKTHRIHTHFNQAVASTGRLSSSDPNLQNIPIRTELGKEIRNTFIAEDGALLISADYSQIELRIVASLAKDKRMLEIFENGEDIHKATAAAINKVPLNKVTSEMRRAAKEVNFGVLYGMGVYGLASRTGIPQWQAKEFIDGYFRAFFGVRKYIDDTLKFAKKEGYVETLFGRRRYVPELKSENYQLRNAGERMAINMPIQGTAADIMKLAMIEVDKQIFDYEKEHKLAHRDVIRLTLQVHDELILEVKKDYVHAIAELVKIAMTQVSTLRVPIDVHVSIGKQWGQLK